MNRPWFPLYVADYLADNTELSIVEHGVFCLLLMHCWRLNGQLPNDLKQLYRMCGATNQHEKKAVEKVVGMRFLTSENRMWLTSKRLCEELDKCLKISEKRSASAVQMHSKSSAKKMQMHTQSQSQSQKNKKPLPKKNPSAECDAKKFIIWWLYAYEKVTGKKYSVSWSRDINFANRIMELSKSFGDAIYHACELLTTTDTYEQKHRTLNSLSNGGWNRITVSKENRPIYVDAGILHPEGTFDNWFDGVINGQN